MTVDSTSSAQLTLSQRSGRWLLVATVLGSGLAGIDATVVNVALPALGDDLEASFAGLQWTLNGYTLTLAAFILLGGSLGDRFGRRRVFTIGVIWFALASALCALAPSIGVLIAPGGGWSAAMVVSAVIGVAAMAGFVVTEHRSPHPMLPPKIFANRQFTAANLVTFAVYAALGSVFFLLVVNLQVVSGFTPLLAGVALLPITVIMLLLSARSGALAGRIGPRLQMTLGPLVAAGGALMFLRIGANASYLTEVVPAVVVFGLGLALIVAPLTTTVLAAAESRYAGIASGVNNAVARAAGPGGRGDTGARRYQWGQLPAPGRVRRWFPHGGADLRRAADRGRRGVGSDDSQPGPSQPRSRLAPILIT